MKSFFILAILISALTFMGTELKAQTTMDEYNYVTKGYKAQVEGGLDMKKGYAIEDVGQEFKVEKRTAKLKKLIRTNAKKELAAYIIIYSTEGKPEEYICVPNPSSDQAVLKAYWNSLYGTGDADTPYKLQIVSYVLTGVLKWEQDK